MPLDGGDNASTTFLGGGISPLKFGVQKMLRIQCDLGQLSTLTIISPEPIKQKNGIISDDPSHVEPKECGGVPLS